MSNEKERFLEEHLLLNFYPPYPVPLRKAIKAAFQEYWSGKIKSEEVFNRINEFCRSFDLALTDEVSFICEFEFFLEEPKCLPVNPSSKS